MIKMPKNSEYVRLKNYERKTIYNSCRFWKYSSANVVMALSYYVFMIYLVDIINEDAVYNLINSMIEESKYCTDILLITKQVDEDFENSTKF